MLNLACGESGEVEGPTLPLTLRASPVHTDEMRHAIPSESRWSLADCSGGLVVVGGRAIVMCKAISELYAKDWAVKVASLMTAASSNWCRPVAPGGSQ